MAWDARAGPSLLFLLIGLAGSLLATSRAQPTDVKVGLIINAASPVGKIANTTIPMALDDFYAAFPNSTARVQILHHDSGGDVVAAASAALQLITVQGARAILGPQSSVESTFVADLGTRAEVPVVSFSATSPSVSPTTARFFSRAALSDAAQAGAIAALVTYFGWRRVVPIYQDDDYGAAFVPFLVDAITSARAAVPYRCALPAAATSDAVAAAMYRMESEQTRAFVLHTRAELAERVFAAAAEAGMMGEGYAWVITDGLTGLHGFVKPPQGVIGLATYVRDTPRMREVEKRWAHRYVREHRDAEGAHAEMGCYAVWAYDAAWAVASAAERLSSSELSSPPGLVGGKGGPTDIAGLGKSMSGEKFLRAINDTKFEGLGGRFELIDGELKVPAFEVVNIMDNGKERSLGFWSQQYGLTRHIYRRSKILNGELKPVIWPGDSTVRPSGWVQPTIARKLQVAVPGNVSDSYRPIVHFIVDPVTNQTTAGGFVIEVFEAAVRLLPYALPFEYVKAKSMPYDELVQAVGNGTFDAAVADITMTADRSINVDFTLPYEATAIAMVVPVRDQRSSTRTWVFLKPLRYDLWLVSAVFFLFTGFVVWAIEHRGNEDFRGPPSYQVGTLLYFGFSTLVFAHKENLKSNLSRLALLVWVFVVLILQSSYTASLASMLTVPQLEPTVTDYGALQRSAKKVGVMNNSFVLRAMTGLGFSQERLVRYPDAQSFHEALVNGSISAIVNETPYLKIFLKTYRDNFTMISQLNKTGGFGFAFPKGSPYVIDLSQAILKLTESDEMNLIERKWFGDDDDDGDAQGDGQFTSDSLSFSSFWGLFLITGATSLLCCAIHLVKFVATNQRELPSNLSWKGRLWRLAKIFDDKDPSSHTFKIKDDGGSMAGRNVAVGSPRIAQSEFGSPLSAPYTSEWSMERASPATGEIELAAGGEERVEVAPNTDGSGENGIRR
uniref:Uncharacterized protein n=1 Tax=Avena sativa TaxID=4498 RepID=A0ACD5Y276_AVESA